jgi:PIN domain nuclease of toxin-antitoxin system
MSRPILLDTCALIWILNGDQLRSNAEAALLEAAETPGQIIVSPISAWEVGQLVSKRRIKLVADPLSWFQEALDDGMVLASMSPGVLVAASFLPGSWLRDPADRILAATARTFGYRLMTRDRPLLDFATEGHLQAIAC